MHPVKIQYSKFVKNLYKKICFFLEFESLYEIFTFEYRTSTRLIFDIEYRISTRLILDIEYRISTRLIFDIQTL